MPKSICETYMENPMANDATEKFDYDWLLEESLIPTANATSDGKTLRDRLIWLNQ